MDRNSGEHLRAVAGVLDGIAFPARRVDLLCRAAVNHADADVLQRIERLPDQEYASLDDVMARFGKAH